MSGRGNVVEWIEEVIVTEEYLPTDSSPSVLPVLEAAETPIQKLLDTMVQGEDPEFDDGFYCGECRPLFQDQSDLNDINGPSFILDSPTTMGVPQRALLTLPHGLMIGRSSIPNAGLGVINQGPTVSPGMHFGPYEGEVTTRENAIRSDFSWEIYKGKDEYEYIDAAKESHSNWMRYVNCARNEEEKNLLAVQYKDSVLFHCCRTIHPGDELMVEAAGVSLYEQKELAEFLPGLWTSLRRELFQTSSEKIESAGLATLNALSSRLSRLVLNSDSEDLLSTFLDLVLKDCREHLSELELKLLPSSAKLLQAAASASYRASSIVAAAIIPSLVEQYNNRAHSMQRRTLLELLQRLLQPVPGSLQSPDEEDSVFSAYRQSLCTVVFSALSENYDDLQITATLVLTAMGQQSLAIVACAGSLAGSHPAAFVGKIVLRLKTQIFSEPLAQGDNSILFKQHSQHALRQRCVSALAAVSTQPSMVQESTPVLLEVLSAAHTGIGGFSVEEVVSACRSLQTITQQVQDTEEMGRYFHDIVIPRLLAVALQAALQGEGSSGPCSPLQEEAVLSAIVPVFSTSCSRLQPRFEGQTASRAVSLFLDGDVAFLPDNSCPPHIQLLQVCVCVRQTRPAKH